MKELIDKGALMEEVKSLTVHVTGLRAGKGVLSKFMDEYRKSVLRITDEQPTTTEADIRAKAIDETVAKLKDWMFENDGLSVKDVREIDEIAEQLKGE